MLSRRVSHVLALTALLLVGGTITGTMAGSASAAPYKCFFVTDPQGHVIDEVCVPWPLG